MRSILDIYLFRQVVIITKIFLALELFVGFSFISQLFVIFRIFGLVFLYQRYVLLDPFHFIFLILIKILVPDTSVIVEIPTYPYDFIPEYRSSFFA